MSTYCLRMFGQIIALLSLDYKREEGGINIVNLATTEVSFEYFWRFLIEPASIFNLNGEKKLKTRTLIMYREEMAITYQEL